MDVVSVRDVFCRRKRIIPSPKLEKRPLFFVRHRTTTQPKRGHKFIFPLLSSPWAQQDFSDNSLTRTMDFATRQQEYNLTSFEKTVRDDQKCDMAFAAAEDTNPLFSVTSVRSWQILTR